ncbi:DinB family protein [uncultured Dokdonia sp.]|uniref:DinB family protein n=1 Tax=uncultured Dokdonia sp. TaxID=575653 RepID=UPI002621CC5C|nr:DinB family protein [uncultured Dokdonia sp.]
MTIQYYAQQLEAINYKALWVGQNVMEKIDGISDHTAFIRPIPELHSVAEIIGHLIALQIEVINKLRVHFNLQQRYQPLHWRSNEELKTIGWKQLKEDYEKSILSIIVLIGDKDDSLLEKTYREENYKSIYPFEFALEGVIHHAIYHLGQISITIKLLIKKELHVQP